MVRYLKTQVAKLGVDIRLGKEGNKAFVRDINPDVLIIAAGAVHNIPDLPGINKRHVVTSKALHRQLKGYMRFFSPQILRALTSLWMPIGKRVAILGGNIQGCQTAEFLVRRGRKVTILDTADEIGTGLLEAFVKPHLLDWLDKRGVTMLSMVEYERITDRGLIITTKEGEKRTIEADTIITAFPLLPNTQFIKELEGIVPEVYVIGDCRDPNLVVNAIADGARVARAF